ncbi:PREDICTED: maturin [Crocodylus porosus]|uniref:maturin n=1 Tax=Crocodylus porosus TaxID=8502 RepID=UPI000938EF7C|nr:PREDICTED: maturin [Crocodylus porosus]
MGMWNDNTEDEGFRFESKDSGIPQLLQNSEVLILPVRKQYRALHLNGVNLHVWSESEDCLPFLQLAQDYISSCGKKTLHEILEKVFKSFRPLLGLPDVDDDAFEEYNADVEEEEPEADHQQMGVSQQ